VIVAIVASYFFADPVVEVVPVVEVPVVVAVPAAPASLFGA
jgi:hypothetical protein